MFRYRRHLAGILAAIVVTGILLPAQVQVQRETIITAHAATVFALINDFRQVRRWAGWMNEDPNARFEFSGPARGAGASLRWDGRIIGSGQQSIVASTPYSRVTTTLIDDSGNLSTATFALAESEGKTRLVWTYERDFGFNLFGRLYGLMLDTILGARTEQDLLRLKKLAEQLPGADFSGLNVEQLIVDSSDIAYRRTASPPDAAAISEAMGDAYFDVLRFIDDHGLEEAGAPLSISRAFSDSELVFDAAIPVRGIHANTPRTESLVKIGQTYAGPVIRVRHRGPYRTLGGTHEQIAAWLAALGIERNGDAWEVYVTDPTKTVEPELLTFIYYPVR
jgi:effector-binding domain-containing protein/uncharacterized protein YndB with AHSA1/START domain